jgi:hypothetical protein
MIRHVWSASQPIGHGSLDDEYVGVSRNTDRCKPSTEYLFAEDTAHNELSDMAPFTLSATLAGHSQDVRSPLALHFLR